MSTLIKFVLHLIGLFLRTGWRGVPTIFAIGVVLWGYQLFLAQMDGITLTIIDSRFSIDLSKYPLLGIGILFLVAVVIALIAKIKLRGRSISLGTAISLITHGKLKRVLNSPLIEVELFPGTAYFRGWLVDVVREKVTMKDGHTEYRTFYYCFFPSANLPTSGWAPTVNPEAIKWVLQRPSSRLIGNIFSFGTSGNDWRRREFDPKDFPPHNPDLDE